MNSLTSPRFLRALRISALVIALATAATWVGTGAHRGWTRTTIVEQQFDEITGIQYPVSRPGFIAGLEVLALGIATAAGLAGATLLPRLQRVRAR
ncbi:MAG TPA: hypothetical protein VGD88_11400 [Opitutaceae bacterium]